MGGGDVLVQQAQGRGARGTGEVELGKLAFGEGRGRPTPIGCFATLLRRDKSIRLHAALLGGTKVPFVATNACFALAFALSLPKTSYNYDN